MSLLLGLFLFAQGFMVFDGELPPLPTVQLELRDLIDIVLEFRILMEDNPTFCRTFYGLTDYESKTISICTLYTHTQQAKTFLHEAYHVKYHKLGIDTGGPYEPEIDRLAQEAFLRLYGSGAVKN